jgi:hypothetical protein
VLHGGGSDFSGPSAPLPACARPTHSGRRGMARANLARRARCDSLRSFNALTTSTRHESDPRSWSGGVSEGFRSVSKRPALPTRVGPGFRCHRGTSCRAENARFPYPAMMQLPDWSGRYAHHPNLPDLPTLVSGAQEDEILKTLVRKQGARNWSLIAQGIPGRSGKSCRLRWCNQLDPTVKKEPFSELEDSHIIAAQRQHGNKWAIIARFLPGRCATLSIRLAHVCHLPTAPSSSPGWTGTSLIT